MMKVFVTGATGYIGKRVVRELISLGHSVVGLTRSENGAKAIKELGAVPVFGDLSDPQKLSNYAKECSGIIHLAMDHNFSDYERSVKMDREIVNMFCREVMGTNKAFVFTTATLVLGPSTGDSFCDDSQDITTLPTRGRGDTEKEAILLAKQNPNETARICAVRPSPFVYGEDGPGFLKHAIECSKKAGYSGYMGDGTHFSTACNVDDMAHLYVLAVTKGKNGSSYNGASDFFNFKDLANSIGKLEGLPIKSISQENGEKYFEIAFLAYVFSVNHRATSTRAEKELGWKPVKTRGILYDVEHVCKP